MDDVKLLSLTGIGRGGQRHAGPATSSRWRGKKGAEALSVWTGSATVPGRRPGQTADTGDREQQEEQHASLVLKSIAKGGLPRVDGGTKTRFYSVMMRLNNKASGDGVGGDEASLAAPPKSSALPGSQKKKKNTKFGLGGTPKKRSTTPAGSPPSPTGSLPGFSNRSPTVRPASVASSSPSKSRQLQRGAAATAVSETGRAGTSSGASRVRSAVGNQRAAARSAAAAAVDASTASRQSRKQSGNQQTEPELLAAGAGTGAAAEGYARSAAGHLQRAHRTLTVQHAASARDEALQRLQLMLDADQMVSNLPLAYLYARPDLRHYAVARAVSVLYRLCLKKAAEQCRLAFEVWKNPPIVVMNEKQVGFMVISKRLEGLLMSALRFKFDHWAHLYSVRFLAQRDVFRNSMAIDIQRWFRLMRIIKREPFKRLLDAIQVCLQRRRAIKYTIEFEMLRRKAQQKVLNTILTRRRRFFAVRSIIRVKRWLYLRRKVAWRLTRLRATRMVQRWWRMVLCRPESDREIIRFIVRIGGVSQVRPRVLKLPPKFIRDGLLPAMNMLASMVQRAWLTSKGQLAMFMILAAKRAKAEYEKMLNDNATVIQQNWRGYLWKKLCSVAIIWNRARRIQRGYRAYQYRCWVHQRLEYRYIRYVRLLQNKVRRWLTRRLLKWRFKARKAMLIFTRAKKSLCANMIQRCFRDYKERERIKKELLIAMIASLRANAEKVISAISKIQRNWRQNKNLDKKGNGKRFPKHVRIIIEKIIRKQRLLLDSKARVIQRQVKIFVPLQIRKRHKFLRAKANIIWRFAKAYLLKLAIWDRIEARQLREKNASNVMKRNLRKFLFRRKIYLRGRIRGVQRRHKKELNDHATYIQRWLRRKRVEYWVLPVRKAARINVAKNREREFLRREAAKMDKAARVLVRFLKPWPTWARFVLRVAKEIRYYVERKAAKKMQKFARRVVAWARFDRVIAYKKRMIALSFINPYYSHAVNIIGHYWKRYREKFSLGKRFTLRRKMMEEWERLEARRLQAEVERKQAEEDKRRTDENMAATIRASWKEGSDALTGKNYFYNYVTGETSWEPPENWAAPVNDIWMRQTDEKGNVYYYNMKTQESQWLPPCTICGEMGERFCADCQVAYCEKDYDLYHLGAMADDEEWAEHKWSLTEYASDILKPGEVYCVECTKRVAAVVCTTCWDNYCKVCFNFIHHTGQLKYHKAVAYQKARKGWTVRKGTVAGEVDFYVNGATGETTYEKPEELMTPEELLYFTNFKSHEKAAQDHIETIKKLQFDVESIAYERDLIVQRALESGANIGDILAKRQKKKPNRFAQDVAVVDVVSEVAKKTKPGYKLFTEAFAEYRLSLLNPRPRARGGQKSEFIEKLLIESGGSPDGSPGKKKKK